LAITKEQKAALEAAGYTVYKNTVKTKSGGSVGGYNENGNIWSGSKKVADILKSKPTEPKTAPKTAAKASPSKQKKAPTKDAMKGYREGDVTTTRLDKVSSGRGDGKMETLRRTVDRGLTQAQGKLPAKGAALTPPKPKVPARKNKVQVGTNPFFNGKRPSFFGWGDKKNSK
jgi:soluble cytochrome b562